MVDLYNAAARYARRKQTLATWPVAETTRAVLAEVIATKLDATSPGRRYADLCLLRRVVCGTRAGKPALLPPDVADLDLERVRGAAEQLQAEARAGQLSRTTFRALKRLVTLVYRRYLLGHPSAEGEALVRSVAEWFVWPPDRLQNVSVQRYYTYEEFRRLLTVARRPQERALLAVGWETTARPNEYLSLTVGDVTPTAHGFTLHGHVSKQVGGTTRTRNLYVLAFRAEFAAHWNTHAFRANPHAPLFYRDDCRRHRGTPLGPAGANLILKK
jgi:hypothetical protein